MSFQQEFNSVLQGGEGVLHRLSSDRKCVGKTLDILRVLIKCRLESAESEISKAELASALILFSELYPGNTEPKMAVLKSLRDEIVVVAGALSEDDDADRQFYAEKLNEKGTPLQTVMMDTIECVHSEWASRIKSEVEQGRIAGSKIYTHELFTLMYLGSSIFFCYLTCVKMSISKCLLSCVPGLGQVFCMVECFQNYGFWDGMASILGGLIVMSFLGPAIEGKWN